MARWLVSLLLDPLSFFPSFLAECQGRRLCNLQDTSQTTLLQCSTPPPEDARATILKLRSIQWTAHQVKSIEKDSRRAVCHSVEKRNTPFVFCAN
ncbi:hypothetical protein DM860_011198 [Cuscuta australis]|uniref:Secreted protein n=1 Tax=Cuscuta australis TaxID=267555 RepID=A0A328DQB4_9ASTE|nr:hypothetical protein DM860_011198 [Cuscuta australis]